MDAWYSKCFYHTALYVAVHSSMFEVEVLGGRDGLFILF